MLQAFINVSTFSGFRISSVSLLANAHVATDEFIFYTLLAGWTRRIRTTYVRHCCFLAPAVVRVSGGAARTLTGE